MLRIGSLAIVALVLGLASSFAFAADTAAGKALALSWCAACHLVAAEQDRVPTVAPPFATIANKPDFNTEQLARSIQFPHPQMPGRELAREQAADIAAYIATRALSIVTSPSSSATL
jgi:mono/diheme cytochrome c family protein